MSDAIAQSALFLSQQEQRHVLHVQGAVLLDPYATAIIGRREFGAPGPVSPLTSCNACVMPLA